MPLHPQIVDVMEQRAAVPVPSFREAGPELARVNSARTRALVELDVVPLDNIYGRTIPSAAGGIPVRIYKSAGEAPHPLVMLFHGGGWVVGDLDSEDNTCRAFSRDLNATVVSVDYRLAPETPYPGAVEDCYAATVWAVEHAEELEIDPAKVATSGTSAGGNLSAAVSLMARDRGGPKISHQALFCPVIDSDFDRPSYLANADDYGLTRDAMLWFWEQYLPDGNYDAPYAAVIQHEDLSGLPDATVIAAEFDPLLDEADAYAHALEAAGCDVTFTMYEGMIHGFNGLVGPVDAARDAIAETVGRMRASFQAVGAAV